MSPRLLLVAIGALLLACGLACDPVHSDAVSDLGPEAPGVPTGPTHRPGQPCVVCHGGSGPGSPQWSVAGTVYENEEGTDPLVGGQVILTDATGSTRTIATNEVGNFYVSVDDWSPVYPLHALIEGEGTAMAMTSRISGNGSCADCHLGHTGQATYDTVPALYLHGVDGGAPP